MVKSFSVQWELYFRNDSFRNNAHKHADIVKKPPRLYTYMLSGKKTIK